MSLDALDSQTRMPALQPQVSRSLGFYLHVPFCSSRCGYCDFNTYTASELGADASKISRETWAHFAEREIVLARESEYMATDERVIDTVFFGGGTPTLVSAADLASTLAGLRNEFGFSKEVEVTTEANPDSVDAAGLAKLREAGFTRISFGHQSSSLNVLKVLERSHQPSTTWDAVAAAKAAGFEHINIDLIYGTPGETTADLERTLADVAVADVDHVSAYSLIVEPGTRLASQVSRGHIQAPDDDVAAERYQLIDQFLHGAGYRWYEVSNWAKPGGQCLHNLVYWHNHDWWGIGPGAHSHMRGRRWWNHKHPATWGGALAAGSLPVAQSEHVDDAGQAVERIMLGLRLREGLAFDAFASEVQGRIPALVARGLVETADFDAGRVVLTDAGRLLADAVVRELTP